jgi:hypothetical protein
MNANSVLSNYVKSNGNVDAGGDVNANRVFSNYVKSNGDLEGNTLTTRNWSDNVAGLRIRDRIYIDGGLWAGGNVEGWDVCRAKRLHAAEDSRNQPSDGRRRMRMEEVSCHVHIFFDFLASPTTSAHA